MSRDYGEARRRPQPRGRLAAACGRRRLRPRRGLRPGRRGRLIGVRRRLAGALRRAREEHLDLGERLANLLAGARLEQVDDGAHGLDSDPRLLEVALVGLADAARGEVEDARDALQEQVLDPHLAQLFSSRRCKLLLARGGSAVGSSCCGSAMFATRLLCAANEGIRTLLVS